MEKPNVVIIGAPASSKLSFLARLASGHENVGEKVVIIMESSVGGEPIEFHSEDLPRTTPFVIKQMPPMQVYVPERKNKTRGWSKNNRKKK